MTAIVEITSQDLGQLNASQSVEIFRDLLWSQARKLSIPITKVHITQAITIGDGGIDAAIDDDVAVSDDDLLLCPGTAYQIKTGVSFKPWQPSQLKKELFGKSKAEVKIENLNDGIKACLSEGKRYVIVCFGVDPTEPQLKKAKGLLCSYFQQCDYDNPNVAIWGQTHLVGLISEFPSLCLKILGRSEYQFQTIDSWSQNDDMQPEMVLGAKQEQFIQEIRTEIRSDTFYHFRVVGEPGIGKTRLILEVLQEKDIAPTVVYIRHAEEFQQSLLFNNLLKTDLTFYIILVIDECSSREMASIWNVLKSRAPQCRLITIDHMPEEGADNLTKILQCPTLGEEQVKAIIEQYISSPHTQNWARWCEGSPRVAHLIGLNLANNPDDILKPPATVPIWERFVAGYEDPTSASNQQRLVVLRHIALFQKFGFESIVAYEAEFIASLVKAVDPSITWGRFQSLIVGLKQGRILQGRSTLFLVPKALHVYLWLDYWKHYGRGFNFARFIADLPESLRGWFLQMFIYAHADPLAQQVVKEILQPGGLFDDDQLVASEYSGRLLSILAEADPKSTLHCIRRNLEPWSKDQLRAWIGGRQRIVWALEKIAIWEATFSGAAKMLRHLGAAENSNVSNNASGIFAGLFSLNYGPLASTEASPEKRLPILKETLESSDLDIQLLGVKACERALSERGFRSIGPEYQGVKPAPKFWVPETYGEIFDAYREVWTRLFEVSRDWEVETRKQANDVLMRTAFGLWRIRALEDLVFDTLEKLIADEATNISYLVSVIVRTFRFDVEVPETVSDRLKRLDQLIAGNTLTSQIRRYVLFSSWDEEYDRDRNEDPFLDAKIDELAHQFLANQDEHLSIIVQLTSTQGHKLYQFGGALANHDPQHLLLPKLIESLRKADELGATQLIGGYLNQLRLQDEAKWEVIMLNLSLDVVLQSRFGEFVWRTAINDQILNKMLEHYDTGILQAQDFSILRYPNRTQDLSDGQIEAVIQTLLKRAELVATQVALEITHSTYREKWVKQHLSEELVFEVLTQAIMPETNTDTMQNYQWGEVAKRFINQYPGRSLALFEFIVSRLDDWSLFTLKRSSNFHKVLAQIAQQDPTSTWEIVATALSDIDSPLARSMLHWLRAEDFYDEPQICPITYFPLDMVLAWIEKDANVRAPIIMEVAPKTLDQSVDGKFTSELLHRYDHLERVGSILSGSFSAFSWVGNLSDYFRKRRDLARSWLKSADSPVVIEWIEDYIENLNEQIESTELHEEREF